MISLLAQEYFANSPVLIYPLIAMLTFVLVFVAATVRALRMSGEDARRMARLPLETESWPGMEESDG
ncbi:MAG: hypothetical protein OEY14_02025 [Myxococcales bacterium]|nr:hypothetical protein [Myxococcales bacterium]